MSSIYGKMTQGLDGLTYRSMFEADFANKFLFETIDYEYEKPYNDGTKRKCDFYIKSLDLWIECAYHDIVDNFAYQKNKGAIPLKVPYQDKDIVKKRGAKFDWTNKIWYVPEELNTGNRLEKFENWMSRKQLELTQLNNSQITENYEPSLRKKLIDNADKKIIVVSYKDVSNRSINHIYDLIRVCYNSYYCELLNTHRIKQNPNQIVKKPNHNNGNGGTNRQGGWDKKFFLPNFSDKNLKKNEQTPSYLLAWSTFQNLQPGDRHRFIQSIVKLSKGNPRRKKKKKKKFNKSMDKLINAGTI